ncbi:rare lipoprotein A [Paraburkholderia caballeronis]|uniref:Endolytic peptidoglycan transglycosylase RlpA n=1 Tax=Paraburkholderia caballeronis TaxID=416943 RepID=A0A1H7HIJ9_9BURK|nr:rare lipoprotein A [Paraburkholderia caballeronis]PXX04745.1 rare lipoprotein A [Paraburkholderia caballeronis]RAK05806.1 rare lipoprotein A [Paraburkholderia caballeronis]TDV18586.1 rare lipoprotein A [Paraburkholderia caballeronis]TDV19876.1 rare lipoprotein A [Paraburkholderia caballeronis]
MSILAGCAMPPGPQSQADGNALSTKSARTSAALVAPPSYGTAAFDGLPASDASNDKSLADAQPISESGPDVSSFRQAGRASWYGLGFHGRRTASGERYDMHALTAAHRSLPLGSYVKVSIPATTKWVVVKINDRGPFSRGRVIDLSYAAARMLGLQHAGTARVQIEGLSRQEAKEARAEMLAAASNTDH